MGGILNPVSAVLSTVSTLGSALGAANNAYNAKQNYQTAKASYDATEQSIQQDHDIQAQEIQLNADNENRKRRDALRRAMSKQQAAFGEQGIDTTDGSGQAVLLGLFDQSQDERAYQDRLTQLKKAALEQDTVDKRRRNLLTLQSGYTSARNDLVQSDNQLSQFYNKKDSSGDE